MRLFSFKNEFAPQIVHLDTESCFVKPLVGLSPKFRNFSLKTRSMYARFFLKEFFFLQKFLFNPKEAVLSSLPKVFRSTSLMAEKPSFFEKEIFSSNCSSGEKECYFVNFAKVFRRTAKNFSSDFKIYHGNEIFQKRFVSSSCTCGHVDCNFDNAAAVIRLNVQNFLPRSPKLIKKYLFPKKNFEMILCTRRVDLCQRCCKFFTICPLFSTPSPEMDIKIFF